MIMVSELELQDMTGAICQLFPKYGAIFAKSSRSNRNSATDDKNFSQGNRHAIVKIVLITKLQMHVLAHKHYKISLLLLILII